MSDLISRSEAVQRLIKETVDSKNNLIHINTVKRLLQDVDTSYDIDQVVDELENNSFITVKNEEVQTKRKDIQSYIAVEKEVVLLKDAIEIVKNGGVYDDVCEWESKYINERYFYQTGCGRIFEYELDSRICLFCGRKLRMVEE